MSLPKKVYKDFFAVVMGGKKPASEREGVYHLLAYHRYDEVLSGAFARFKAQLDETVWEELVRNFMTHGARSPLIWQMPNEFRRWVLKGDANLKWWPWAKAMLWFEWQEINLMMKQPVKRAARFDPAKPTALAPTAKAKKLDYRVYAGELDEPQQCGAVVFLNPKTLMVEFLEITPFMADFLKRLKKPVLLDDALKAACKKHKLDPAEVAPVILKAYRIFWQKGIFIQGD
ncbi:MAG: putative DNA-binding domain-containing protein [Campylobacterales bacterium]